METSAPPFPVRMADEEPQPMPGAETLLFPGMAAITRFPEDVDAEELAASTLLEGFDRPETETEEEAAPSETEAIATPPEAPAVSAIPAPLQPKANQATQEPPPAPKQSHVKISCPNCGSPGTLPWGRLGRLLCCSHCWHWYRLASHGKLEEVPAPKEFIKGTLRVYKGNGEIRVVEVTPADIKRKRRDARTMERITALKYLNISDHLVLWVAAAYFAGMAIFSFSAVFAQNRVPLLPSLTRGPLANPRQGKLLDGRRPAARTQLPPRPASSP